MLHGMATTDLHSQAADGITGFSGDLIGPDHPQYDEARKVWNGDIDRRPPLIAQCRSADDVAAVVRFAGDQDVPVAVKGGGHAVAGYALCEDGVVVDLSPMRGVELDVAGKRATVQGGALWSDVDAVTQEHGLAVTGGIVSHTGVGGLTLGGGIGHLMRRCGLTIDNLVSAEVVTAAGETVTASADSEPELFWGLRGGGGNFGVVTEFEFQLHDVGPEILAGLVVYPLDEAPAVLRNYRDAIADAPDELGTTLNLRLCPPLPVLPESLHGTPIVGVILNWTGPMDRADDVLRPYRDFGEPAADTVTEKPYVAHQQMIDAAVPHGNHYYWRSAEFDRLTDAAIDTIVDNVSNITSPMSTCPVFHMGGAVARVDEDATAFGSRAALHDINMVSSWLPDDDRRDEHVAWVRGFSEAMAAHRTGTYTNFISDESDDAVRSAYGDRWERLRQLKREWDPDNRFRYNANIDPA